MPAPALLQTMAARTAVAPGGGGWTPADLPGIVDYWLADDAGSITASGGSVSAWAGQLGNKTFVQATSGKQPSTGVANINGKNAIQFTGSGGPDYLHFSLPGVFDNYYSWAVIFQKTTGANTYEAIVSATTGGSALLVDPYNATRYINSGSGGGVTGTWIDISTATSPTVLVGYAAESDNTYTERKNGVQTGTIDFGAPATWTTSSGRMIVGSRDDEVTAFTGKVLAIVLTTGALTGGTDLADLETYLMDYAGLNFYADDYGTVLAEYDASDTSTITSSSGAVSAWAPKSGSLGVTLGWSGGKPATGTRTQAGQNVLDMTLNTSLLIADISDESQPFTLVAVFRLDTPSGNQQILGHLTGHANIITLGGTFQMYPADTGVAHTSSPVIFIAIFNGSSSIAYINGTATGTLSTSYTLQQLVIGDSNYTFDGWFAHAVYYDGVVADPAALSAALNAKWQVY